jgi:hypothetical protein
MSCHNGEQWVRPTDVPRAEYGKKHDFDKLEWSQIPIEEMEQVVAVLTKGAKKYGSDDNWQRVPDGKKRYFNALLRHIMEWQKGNINDSESGYSHLAHAMANCLFLMWIDRKEKSNGN